MKNFLFFVAGVLATTVSAFAVASVSFTDSSSFPSWSTDSIMKMADKGVIKGYGDGSFRPNNSITRAESAVLFDRFNDLSLQNTEKKLFDFVFALNSLGYIDVNTDPVNVALIMAEAGMYRYAGDPTKDFEELEESTTNIDLPENYSVYQSEPFGFFLRYQGMKNFGQDGWEVDEWYGPFTYYGNFNRFHSADFY